jgi:hypothetical protein
MQKAVCFPQLMEKQTALLLKNYSINIIPNIDRVPTE